VVNILNTFIGAIAAMLLAFTWISLIA
jgi:uncharacterized membrane protein